MRLTVLVDFLWMKLSIIWDVSLCEICTLTKLFLLGPSTAEYLLLTDRTLGSIPAMLVPKEHGSSHMLHLENQALLTPLIT